jgi:hypothetical protein
MYHKNFRNFPEASYLRVKLEVSGLGWVLVEILNWFINLFISDRVVFYRALGNIFKFLGREVEDWNKEDGDYTYFRHPFLKYVVRSWNPDDTVIWECEGIKFPS